MLPKTKEAILVTLENRKRIDNVTGCWLYTKCLSSGYGQIRLSKKFKIYVHRLSAHLYLDYNLDSDKIVLHKRECPNRHCFSPEHLYIGTDKENCRDWIAVKGYKNQFTERTSCQKGHEYTDKSTRIDPKTGQRVCKICTRIRAKISRKLPRNGIRI